MKNRNKKSWLLCACLFISLCGSNSAVLANTQPPNDNDWHFLFAPYLWMSGLNGDTTVHNITNDVKLTFADILDNFQGGGEAHAEATHGRWTLMLDATYMRLAENFNKQHELGTLSSRFTTSLTLIDGAVFYRIFNTPVAMSSLELYGGGRYYGTSNSLDVDVTLDPSLGGGMASRTDSGNATSLSPIVGARLKSIINPKMQFWLRGDVGGFHVDGMNNTWSLASGVTYNIYKHVDLAAAYRVLKIDYARPGDAGNFAMNAYLYGPLLGIVFYD